LNFAAQCYPNKDAYIASMIQEAVKTVRNHVSNEQKNNKVEASSVQYLHRILVAPLKSMNVRVLELEEYCALIHYLPSKEDVQSAAYDVVNTLTTQVNVHISNTQQIEKLFAIIEPLLSEGDEKEKEKEKEKK